MAEAPPEAPTVHEVVTALQKAMSRVNEDARAFLESEDSPSDGVALVVGTVNWQLELKASMRDKHLVTHPDGHIGLSLAGQISVPVATDDGDYDYEGEE